MWYMNEERELIRETAKQFTDTEVRPFVKEMEDDVYPEKLVKKMGELGFTGLPHHESYGGLGKDWTTYGIVLEEIGKASTTLALCNVLQTCMSSLPIVFVGSQEQKEKYLKPCLEGKEILAISNTEPAGVVNVAEFQTKAVLEGDEWVINGSKIFTSGAGHADYYVVVALTSEFDFDTGTGISLFWLPANTPGFKVGHPEKKIGWKGSSSCSVYYDNVRVPKENLIGELGASASVLGRMTAVEALCVGSICLGGAQEVFDKTVKYTKERIQLGKSLFDNYQVVRHDLAKMYMKISQLRALSYHNYYMMDTGKITVPQLLEMKVIGAETMEYVASKAIELHGGNGVVFDNDVERFLRDAKVNAIGGGSSGILTDKISSFL